MSHRKLIRSGLFIMLILLLAACAGPRSLPAGLTPIPTLAPATEPASPLGATEPPSFAIQSYPARLPSAEQGQALYNQQCANCHGVDGEGVVAGARNFNDLDYMRGETPASFYAAVTEGRGDMPAFRDRMTSDERWDVVFYVWRFATTEQKLALGEQIYETNCAVCHGEDGTGQVLGAADFTDLRLVDERAPRDFYLAVTQGVGSMPAWQGRLSQDERWAVIEYLRTFSYDPEVGDETVVSVPPTSTPQPTACEPYLGQANPFAWDDSQAITAGQVIYDQSCAVCHGDDGAGSLPNILDLTTAEAQNELRNASGEALCVVAEGRASMPGWKETLSTEEMWQVITYIGSLGG